MANKQQISAVTSQLVTFQDAFAALSAAEVEWIVHNGRAAVELFVRAVSCKVGQFAESADSVLASSGNIGRDQFLDPS